MRDENDNERFKSIKTSLKLKLKGKYKDYIEMMLISKWVINGERGFRKKWSVTCENPIKKNGRYSLLLKVASNN